MLVNSKCGRYLLLKVLKFFEFITRLIIIFSFLLKYYKFFTRGLASKQEMTKDQVMIRKIKNEKIILFYLNR